MNAKKNPPVRAEEKLAKVSRENAELEKARLFLMRAATKLNVAKTIKPFYDTAAKG